MRILFSVILLSLFSIHSVYAQPSNDGCENPIPLNDVSDWCSSFGEFTNIDATDSGYNPATCWTNTVNDVWFSFVAIAPDVSIFIEGNAGTPGGTLAAPEAAIYNNNCGGTISELGCISNASNTGIIELYEGGLTVGQTYLIRVDGRNSGTGTFKLCIRNYNPPVLPGGDCNTRAFLCDKSSFTIPSISGVGAINSELNGTCLGGETNSTWFAWTCGTAGTLTFTISPTDNNDDLDFIIYELPNGLNDCSNKNEVRCMAASCTGATGLNDSSSDTTEPPGCPGSSDNFIAALDMQAGVSYALAINNFTATGNGFSIDWGGTAEFEGPQTVVDLSATNNTICMGETLTVDDLTTTSLGTIVGQSWNFGVDASPAISSGAGPHTISYSSVGTKSITLTVENSLGCIVTEIVDVIVDPCCETVNAMVISSNVSPIECFDSPNGAIDMNITTPFPITSTTWDNGATTEDLTNLTGGDYMVTITNQFCEEVVTFTVPSPPAFEFDTIMTLATCGGGTDGALELNVNGATPPYVFDWNDGNGFTSNNQISNLAIGTYTVTVLDDNNCEKILDLEVKELELELDPTVDAVTPPTCFGFNDGSIQLVIANGQAPFMYDWNDGNGFVSDNTMTGIVNATFNVNVMDANGCFGDGLFELIVQPPPPLELDLDSIAVGCFGDSDGSIETSVSGGVGSYQYNWSDGQTDSIAIGLTAGVYTVTVLDANNCLIEGNIEVLQPGELGITQIDVEDVVCFGDSTGQFIVQAFGGNPPFMYSVDGVNFQMDSVLTDVQAGTFDVTILDGMGCTDTQSATINQPLELIALPGDDLTVNLGYSIQIPAEHYPPNKPVTVEWSPTDSLSCTDCFMPFANPAFTTTYTMTITDNTGCVDTEEITIFVNPERPIYVPNAFSPNNDGSNDFFTAYAGPAGRVIKNMKVFDRWGSVLFDKDNIHLDEYSTEGWDGRSNGKALDPGVYAYVIEIEFVDNHVGLYHGDITLLR